jgi:dihydroorotate dehydrogenase
MWPHGFSFLPVLELPALIGLFERLARPFLHRLDPEDAHGLALRALNWAPLPAARADDPRLQVRAFGLNFQNPVGVAAGFDKNAEVPDALLRLGFGFVETGSVTPRPQAGNPRPRIFRLSADGAVINRLGFNNDGAAVVLKRLAARVAKGGIIGINIGANRDSTDRAADYVKLVEAFAPVVSYITVNVSSPNTPGLRNLQESKSLNDLLSRVIEVREKVRAHAGPTPLLLKIAPDLTLADLDDLVGVARERAVDGMIVGNTTLSRPPSLQEREKAMEQGGLSGKPLFPLATRMLAETFVRLEGAMPVIGVGGIDSGDAAVAKLRAGATLVQLYSGLIFHGLGLLTQIKRALIAEMEEQGSEKLGDLVGIDAADITAQPWPV